MKLSLPGRRGGGGMARHGRRERRADRAKLIARKPSAWKPVCCCREQRTSPTPICSPPAVEVANATAALESRAGQDFQKLSSDLSALEQASGVRPGQFAVLEYDATTLDLAIKSSSELTTKQASSTTQRHAEYTRPVITGRQQHGKRLGSARAESLIDLSGVIVNDVLDQAEVAATMPNGVVSNHWFRIRISQMQLIAREAHVTRPSTNRS